MSRPAIRLLSFGLVLAIVLPVAAAPINPAPLRPAAVKGKTDALGDPLPEGALARVGSNRLRHTNWVITAGFSPDGKTIASCGNDSMIRLWDAATGKQIRQLAGHTSNINYVAFSPDGKTLSSASHDSSVRLWDAATGQELRRLSGHQGMVRVAVFSPDGKTLASEANDLTVRLWDVETGKEIRRWAGHQSNGTSNVVWLPDGKTVASATQDFAILLTDAATGKPVRRLEGHTADIESLSVSADGNTIVSGSHDESVRVWDVATGKEAARLNGHVEAVASVRLSPDGKTIASGGYDKAIHLWDVATAREIAKIEGHSHLVSELNFSPDGKVLVSASWDTTVRLWDVKAGKALAGFENLGDPVQSFALSADGKLLATAGTGDRVRLWEPATGKMLPVSVAEDDKVTALALTADGKFLAAANSAGSMGLWNTATGKEVRRIEGVALAQNLAFTSNGKVVVVLAIDGTVRRWETATGQEIGEPLQGAGRNVRQFGLVQMPCMALAPDDRTMAMAQHNGMCNLLDLRTAEVLRTFNLGSVCRNLSFSADGRSLIATRADGTVQVWETATGQERLVLGSQGAQALATVSPEGRFLALATADKKVKLLDLATSRELRSLTGHEGPINRFQFGAAGTLLVSAATDGTALVWDATTWTTNAGSGAAAAEDVWATAWDDLAGQDGAKAFQAMWRFAGSDKGVAYLADKLAPAKPTADAATLERLITDMDSDEFAVREKATRTLEQLGPEAEPALKKVVDNPPSLDAKGRAERLLEKLRGSVTTPEAMRQLRAVEALERSGTAEARAVLEKCAGGVSEALLTREARPALSRLGPAQQR